MRDLCCPVCFQLPSMQPSYIKTGFKKNNYEHNEAAVFRFLSLKPEIYSQLLGTVVIFCSITNQDIHLLMHLFPPLPPLDNITV